MLIKRDWSIMPIFFVKFSCLCNDCIKLNFNYSWDTQSFSLSQHYKETVTTTLLSFVMSLSIKMFSGLCKDQLNLNKLIFTNKLSAIMGIKNCPLISTIYIFSNRALTLVMETYIHCGFIFTGVHVLLASLSAIMGGLLVRSKTNT